METLTLEKLKKINAGDIFAKGNTIDCQEGVNMSNSGRELRWVAKKGFGHDDWAIYIHFAINSDEWIEQSGDKVTSEKNIRFLVPCTDDVFNKYRY
jgi:hypothetical protein